MECSVEMSSELTQQRFAALLDEHRKIVFKVANTYANGVDDRADDNAADPAAEQQLRLLDGFISKLAPLDRALLLLYLEDHRQAQIADILGISESNVATKISRVKQRIRDHIDN